MGSSRGAIVQAAAVLVLAASALAAPEPVAAAAAGSSPVGVAQEAHRRTARLEPETAVPVPDAGTVLGGIEPVGAKNSRSNASSGPSIRISRISLRINERFTRLKLGSNAALSLSFGVEGARSGSADARILLRVQRRVGGGIWRTVVLRTSPVTTSSGRIPVPKFTTAKAAQIVRYRLIVSPTAGAAGPSVRSEPVTVTVANQRHRTGLEAELYAAIRPYCPGAVVAVKRSLEGDAAGEYTDGTYEIRISRLVAGYAEADRRAVALHECAHYKQYYTWGGSWLGTVQAEAAMVHRFRATAIGSAYEHAADCASHAIEPNGYLGYGGFCTPSELAYGRRIMAGERFR